MLNLHKALFVAIEIPCMHLCMVKIQYSNEIFQLQFRVSSTQENDITTKLVNSVSFLMCGVCVCVYKYEYRVFLLVMTLKYL